MSQKRRRTGGFAGHENVGWHRIHQNLGQSWAEGLRGRAPDTGGEFQNILERGSAGADQSRKGGQFNRPFPHSDGRGNGASLYPLETQNRINNTSQNKTKAAAIKRMYRCRFRLVYRELVARAECGLQTAMPLTTTCLVATRSLHESCSGFDKPRQKTLRECNPKQQSFLMDVLNLGSKPES